MKEDYLWDKAGNDPDIEHLERSLARFRYQKISHPEIAPQRSAPENTFSFWRSFVPGFRTAFAGSVIIALITIGLFINSTKHSTNEISLKVPSNSPVKMIHSAKSQSESEPATVQLAVSSTPKIAKKAIKRSRNVIKTRKDAVQTPLANKTAKTVKSSLTQEEKYAYDQLMLALSVTSSKLRLVKDKISLNVANETLIEKD